MSHPTPTVPSAPTPATPALPTFNPDPATLELEVFRTGDYGDKGRYNTDDLDALVADYAPQARLAAPLTFDHAQTGPAYGWVAGLRRVGDRLLARLRDVPEEVAALVRRGAFTRPSIELERALPQTGRPYLRALTLLGAATPEVKGLVPPAFAEGALPVAPLMLDGPETQSPAVLPAESAAHPEPEPEPEVERLRREVTGLRRQARDRAVLDMFAQATASGAPPLDPQDRDALSLLITGALEPEADNTGPGPIWFADGRVFDPLEWLRGFLGRLPAARPQATPPPLPLGSLPAGPGGPTALFSQEWPTEGAAAAAFDPRSLDLHRRALALAARPGGPAYRDALAEASR